MAPLFFPVQADFRSWLEQNHDTEKELLVGFYKVGSGKPSLSWSQSVDEALCFGWIDGVRKSIDDQRYCIRFTHRKPGSIWSAVNLKKIEDLTQQGLMQPAGIAVFEKRNLSRAGLYAYEREPVALDEDSEKTFKENQKAWLFFQSQPPSYRKPALNWVMSARQTATRQKRLQELIEDSEVGLRIKSQRRS
ncbi:MAG: YdeI/OmpD-associated family protein [Verrucomicrobia bacterium]|nr:YdeI/OmpD-associated family protein [Cytophagales bacterium]